MTRISRALSFGVLLATIAAVDPAASEPPAIPAQTLETQVPRTAIRSGSHVDYGRLVIDTDGKTAYHLDQDGDHVVLRFIGALTLGNPPSPPRNVIAIKIDGPTIDLTLQHGAKLYPLRLDGRVVLDILDARDTPAAPANPHRNGVRPEPPHPALSMASSPELGGRSVAELAIPQVSGTAQRAPVAAQPLPAAPSTAAQPTQTPAVPIGAVPIGIEAIQQIPPGRDVLPESQGPIGLLARRVRLPKELEGAAFLVPFDSTTGAAAFRSGDGTYVVFDQRRPVDMSALQSDPVFGKASVKLLAAGTLLCIPLPPTRSLALTLMPLGWRIAALATIPKQQPVIVSYADGHLTLAADQPAGVVSFADPQTGAALVVGTQHRAGQGLANGRRGTQFILRPTIQGVVVEPLADAVTLKQVATGFILSGGPAGLDLSPATGATDGLMDAALLTRRFALSTMPTDALLRRAIKQIDDAAATPPQLRGPKNHLAAETFLALGLSVEAEGLLHMAAEQDPNEAASAETGALTAIAALLAGRPEEADALADPRLDGSDEISLWRGIRQAMQDDGSPAAAATFAVTAPLALQYPDPIREHILPLIIETIVKGGEIEPAARLLDQRKNDPRLAYARALLEQTKGDTDKALGMLDALANGHDQFDRARAAVRAVELRLAAGKLDKKQAADALDKLLYAWRGDARELALRERVAALRGQTGDWRVALATLRQAETDFPDQTTPIRQLLKDTFAAMIRDSGQQQIPPIDFVSMVDENADLAAGSSDDDAVQQMLADRLLELDLPERAKPVLDKLMHSANSDVAKARFGASLATLETRDGDDARAKATLAASEGKDLPPDLTEKRKIILAGAVARLGDPAAAAALLVPFRSAPATEARAQILENGSDWPAAEQAWSDCVALTVPPDGSLDETQTRTLLRLATATARAGDDAGLSELRTKYTDRIGAGPLADMFRLLIAPPIRTTADIMRSQQEVNLAASLPADLKALQPAASGH